MSDLSIQIARGKAAEQLLADEDFLAEWAALCAQCPWTTGFQGPGFARAWYGTYHDRCEPVLVLCRSATSEGASRGALQGLLALANFPTPRPSEAGDTLVVAGGGQAEYHAWVSTAALGDAFPWQAIRALHREFPTSRLTFRYLAPGAPTAWATSGEGRRRCVLRAHRRPLILFGDGSDNAASLAKKSNKRRLKDLDKLGGLEFRRVTDPTEFRALFDDIVRLYDFRHGAVQGTDPFCSLDRQKEFHAAMLAEPGLLHVTTMRVGGRLAAAHFGVVSGKELQLGTIVHDPALAKQSPGKFQLLLLAKMLIAEGFERLDLTPGGDTYKDRFANGSDQVHTLSVLPTAARRAKVLVSVRVKDKLKSALSRRGLTTAEAKHRVKAIVRHVKHPTSLPKSLATGIAGWVVSRQETRIYYRPAGGPLDDSTNRPAPLVSPLAASQTGAATDEPGQRSKDPAIPASVVCEAASGKGAPTLIDAHLRAGGAPLSPPVRRDSLDDLLAYRPAGAGQSRQAFLSAALSRVEAGEHAYTVADGGALLACAWLAGRPDAEAVATLLPGLTVPPDSAILHGFQSFTAAGAASLAPLLRSMLRDAGRSPGVRHLFLALPNGPGAVASAPLARLAAEFGFVHDSSRITETRFGRRRSRVRIARADAVSQPAAVPATPLRPAVTGDPAEPKERAESNHQEETRSPKAPADSPESIHSAGPTRKSQERRQRPAPAGGKGPEPTLSGKTL